MVKWLNYAQTAGCFGQVQCPDTKIINPKISQVICQCNNFRGTEQLRLKICELSGIWIETEWGLIIIVLSERVKCIDISLLAIFLYFYRGHSMSVNWYLIVVLNYISLITNDVEYVFMYLLVFCISYLRNVYSSLCTFFSWVIWFLSEFPGCQSALQILDMPVPQFSHKPSPEIYLYISYFLLVLFLWITLTDTPCMSLLSCYFKILSLALTFNRELKIIIILVFSPFTSSPSEAHIMCMLVPWWCSISLLSSGHVPSFYSFVSFVCFFILCCSCNCRELNIVEIAI